MNKSIKITFRVDEDTFNNIEQERSKLNVNRSKYLNTIINKKKIVVLGEADNIVYELRKIGNNINQLTKLANSNAIKVVNLEETKECIQKIWQSLNLLISKKVT
ncbi:MAG: MobC family plasmid mobilization relaxosome protein [Clostridia bacterium]